MTEKNSKDGNGFDALSITRRTILRGVGAAGIGAVLTTGTAAGRPPSNKCDLECEEETTLAKYDFVEKDDDCYFELSEGEDVVEITITETKDDKGCEPIAISYEVEEGFEVTQLCAFGGNDSVTDAEPDGTFGDDDDEALINNGGQRAAISNITFCVGEDGDLSEFTEWQADLIYGDPIEVFDIPGGRTYNQENRLLQFLLSCEPNRIRDTFEENDDMYADCGVEVVQGLTADLGAGTVSATLDPGDCTNEDFAVVVYRDTDCNFFNSPAQILFDSDTEGVDNGDGTYTYTVDLPL